MVERAKFVHPVYKDQTVVANGGQLIEVGDTLSVVLDGDGTEELQDLVLTHVENGGMTVGWNREVASFRTTDIARVNAKHQFSCAGLHSYSIVLTEATPTVTAASVDDLFIQGEAVAVDIVEADSENGFEAPFVAALIVKLNEILNGNGIANAVAAGSAGTQTLTITFTQTTLILTALTYTGATSPGLVKV